MSGWERLIIGPSLICLRSIYSSICANWIRKRNCDCIPLNKATWFFPTFTLCIQLRTGARALKKKSILNAFFPRQCRRVCLRALRDKTGNLSLFQSVWRFGALSGFNLYTLLCIVKSDVPPMTCRLFIIFVTFNILRLSVLELNCFVYVQDSH